MESYLHNRKQIVNIQGHLSSTQDMPLGNPQGARISPLLFTCLMADLDLWTEHSSLSNFGDDTQSLCIAEDKETAISKTRTDASNIISFFTANDLVNNADKACVVYNSKGKGDQLTMEDIGGERLKSL